MTTNCVRYKTKLMQIWRNGIRGSFRSYDLVIVRVRISLSAPSISRPSIVIIPTKESRSLHLGTRGSTPPYSDGSHVGRHPTCAVLGLIACSLLSRRVLVVDVRGCLRLRMWGIGATADAEHLKRSCSRFESEIPYHILDSMPLVRYSRNPRYSFEGNVRANCGWHSLRLWRNGRRTGFRGQRAIMGVQVPLSALSRVGFSGCQRVITDLT